MLKRILGNHPSVFSFSKELRFFEYLWTPNSQDQKFSCAEAIEFVAFLISVSIKGFFNQENYKKFYPNAQLIVQSIPKKNFFPAQLYKTFMEYTAKEHNKAIPCDKTPKYVYHIQEILELFPEAKVINIVRDPRDVLLSQKNMWKSHIFIHKRSLRTIFRAWANYHPITTSMVWNTAVRAAERFSQDKRVYSIKFEDILLEPEKEIQNMCSFIGILYNANMLNISMFNSSFIPDKPDEIGIDPQRMSNWKNGGLNSAELFITQMLTADMMRKFGYAPAKVFPNPFLLIYYLITFPVKLGLTFLFHRKYLKNVKDAIKRRLF